MNALLSAIFLVDFTYRLFTAESKSRYFFRNFGWADLLASLPVEQLKILRVFRLWRVIRLLREYGARNIARSLIKDRAGSALFTLLLMGVLVLLIRTQVPFLVSVATGAVAYTLILLLLGAIGTDELTFLRNLRAPQPKVSS